MKNIKYLIAIIIFAVSANISYAQVSKVVLDVDGFTCSLCAKGVEGQLKSLDFVKSVKTDLKNASFTLTFNGKAINLGELKDAVTDGGFTVSDIRITASGELTGDASTGFSFRSSGIPSLSLKNMNGNFSNGDKVTVTGVLSSSNSLNVKSIKKI